MDHAAQSSTSFSLTPVIEGIDLYSYFNRNMSLQAFALLLGYKGNGGGVQFGVCL